MLAPVTNMRQTWRTRAFFSAAGPTMKPGVSHRDSRGMSKASQSCMKRLALSAPSPSTAPARCIGSFAITPIGRPSTRMNAVSKQRPNPARNSSTEPVSASAVSTARTS